MCGRKNTGANSSVMKAKFSLAIVVAIRFLMKLRHLKALFTVKDVRRWKKKMDDNEMDKVHTGATKCYVVQVNFI